MARKNASGCLVWMVLIGAVMSWCSPRDKAPAPAPTALIDQTSPASFPTSPPVQEVLTRDTPASAPSIVLYATANVNLRAEPSTAARVVLTVPKGAAVTAKRSHGAWRHATYSGESGWIHGDYLSERLPVIEQPPRARIPEPSAPRAFIESPRRRSGEPIRDPYVGRCDCPYDLMRNGRLCGGRSAYSRPGGRSPECYF